jgi:hypothetical protein
MNEILLFFTFFFTSILKNTWSAKKNSKLYMWRVGDGNIPLWGTAVGGSVFFQKFVIFFVVQSFSI